MDLKNEIEITWKSAIGFTWAIFWRYLIISVPYDLSINFIWIPQTSEELFQFYLLDGAVFLLALTVSVFWVLRKGYGNKRAILFNTSGEMIQKEKASTTNKGENFEF